GRSGSGAGGGRRLGSAARALFPTPARAAARDAARPAHHRRGARPSRARGPGDRQAARTATRRGRAPRRHGRPAPRVLSRGTRTPVALSRTLPHGADSMTILDERFMRAPADVCFHVAADVERWPDILPHYRHVRFHERSAFGRGRVEMAAWRDFGGPVRYPTWWVSEMHADEAE